MQALASVPAADQPGTRRAGMAADDRTVIVALTGPDGRTRRELSFALDGACRLAAEVLSGEPRARTTPGLARMLAATVLVLERVGFETGGLEARDFADERDGTAPQGDGGDRTAAAQDAPAG